MSTSHGTSRGAAENDAIPIQSPSSASNRSKQRTHL